MMFETEDTKWEKIVDIVRVPYWKISKWISDRWYFYIINRPHVVKLEMEITPWMDKDHRILLANMALLVEYVEQEKPFEVINWDYDEQHLAVKKDIQEIYAWWKNYNKRLAEIDESLSSWYDIHKENKYTREKQPNGDILVTQLPMTNPMLKQEETIRFNEHQRLETALENEEQEMLIRLIKIRRYLWT